MGSRQGLLCVLLAGVIVGLAAAGAEAQLFRRCPPSGPICPPGYVPMAPGAPGEAAAAAPAEATPVPGKAAPAPGAPQGLAEPDLAPTPSPGALASAYGAVGGTRSTVPNIIGDALIPYYRYEGYEFRTVTAPPFGLQNLKLSENNNVFPHDRIFLNYSYFNNVAVGDIGILDVNRYVFGAEKTFHEGLTSLEIRFPFANTIASDAYYNAFPQMDTEFGNISLIYKRILRQNEYAALSAGMGLGLPTADDARVFLNPRTQTLHVDNEAVHLVPFVAVANRPANRLFWQSFVMLDVPANGNPIYGDPYLRRAGNALPRLGTLTDQPVLFADTAVGYWIYQSENATMLRGVVPTLELHYSSSTTDSDTITDPASGATISSTNNRFDYLNMTLGMHFMFARGGNITPAFVLPLREGSDRAFDYEVQTQVNFAF